MTDTNYISNELRELQSSLAGHGRPGDSLSVPQEYFEGFAVRMLEKARAMEVADELAGLSPIVAAIPLKATYAVPPAYFDSLDPMAPNREEDVLLSPLMKGLKNSRSFSTPEGYFDNIQIPGSGFGNEAGHEASTEQRIAAAELQKTGSIAADELKTGSIAADELKAGSIAAGEVQKSSRITAQHDSIIAGPDPVSAVLDRIARVTPYTVPASYFASLDALAIVQPVQAKVISIGVSRWRQYAAAASVALLVSLGTIFYFNRGGDSRSADGIVAAAAKEAPAGAIDEFLEETTPGDRYASQQSDSRIIAAAKAENDKEISNLVKNVPDKEIQAFLNETASAESDIDDDDPLLN